jgi:adenylate cyclase
MRKSTRLVLGEFSSELARRKVYSAVAAYAVVAWILLQVGEVTFEPLGLPGWWMTSLIVAVIAGMPIVATVAWFFDLTRAGLRRDSPASFKTTPTVAVLPFVDLSPGADQAYFCDGVAEEILNALSRINQLRVVSRMSSFRYKNADSDARDLGKKLDANAILEGSVRKAGDNLRVTARLINVADGLQFWAKTFDRELKDIFSIQDDIASSIAESLLKTLTDVRTISSRDVVAYEHYLRGKDFLNRFRKVDLEFARQMFQQAIDRDSRFAEAWASYADCFSLEVMYADPTPWFKDKAIDACKRAIELAPELAEAHASCGLAMLITDQYEEAEKYFKDAIALNPQLYEAYYYYGRTRFHQGDLEGAATLFLKASAVNPMEYQARLLRVQILRGLGREREAVAEARKAIKIVERHLEWHPDDVRALHLGAGSLIAMGEIERAEGWLKRALQIDPDDSILLYNVACNYATIDKPEMALDYLEKAAEKGKINAEWCRHDTDLRSLHGHPRFEALLQNKGEIRKMAK